ncbi:MAG: YggS family pyridoxal phosphate-dependent enzyme [Proteobacteria bacterium]|nr:YggS family pyridoxal phosphate-dependent enzyme [Pseudomonadota bacterium]
MSGPLNQIDIARNLAVVKEKIASAARAAGRDLASVMLVAVSKTQDAATIRLALAAGHRTFGENRVQEAAAKWPALRAEFPDLSLHLIGPLQSNKIKKAVQVCDVIESVDSEALAAALAREIAAQTRRIGIFIQVNTGEEYQKAGVAPAETDALVAGCRALGLDVLGLMCIPPADDEPAPHFALLAKMAARNGLTRLSMGMSGDFETAIRFGATSVRVGTAIFGTRPAPPSA